jgi:hypothetical protein
MEQTGYFMAKQKKKKRERLCTKGGLCGGVSIIAAEGDMHACVCVFTMKWVKRSDQAGPVTATLTGLV